MTRKERLTQSVSKKTTFHKNSFNDVKTISIDSIKLNPFQPRKTFNNESLIELSESIKENGLLQPISITENNILIAGERRLKACKILGLKEIKAILIKDVDDKKMEILAILENLQREDLDLFDEAYSIEKLISKSSIRNVAKVLGKSKGYIENRYNLSKLKKEEKKYVMENNLGIKDALQIIKIGLNEFLIKSVLPKDTTKITKKSSAINHKDIVTLSNSETSYILSDKELEIKKIYENNGFIIKFDENDCAIRGKKNKFDAFEILKLLKNK